MHPDKYCGDAIRFSENKSNYAASECPVALCDVCPALKNLDAEILRTNHHRPLVELSKKRRSSESLINNRHDPLTRLPSELISEIFKFYCMDSSSPFSHNTRPLIIGGVCKYWRDVTLGTPQLWSTIILSADANRPYDIDVASEWLSRSRSLLLSLDITFLGHNCTDSVHAEKTTLSPLIHLLRSHSDRWQNITIDAECCQSGHFIPLSRNLENLPTNLETFETHTDIDGTYKVEHDMLPLLLPRTLNAFGGSSIVGLPIGLDCLRSLDVSESMYLDEFLRIIGHTPNLLNLCVTSVLDVMGGSDLSDTRVTSRSITFLKIQSSSEHSDNSVLPYLTLPSLKILDYTDLCYCPKSEQDFGILEAFLDRSSPKPDEFSFSITPQKFCTYVDHWYIEIPSITHLELDVTVMNGATPEDRSRMTHHFLSLVFSRLHDTGLPKLQHVSLFILSPTPRFWAKVHSAFRKLPPIKEAQTISPEEAFTPVHHSLKSCDIQWIHNSDQEAPTLSMYPSLLTSLLEIEKSSGVQILVGDLKLYLSKATNIPHCKSEAVAHSPA